MIPEAAVEAAARAFFGTLAMSKWEDLGPVTREAYCDKSRAALEAAAPHMLAAAWDEGMEAMYATTGSEWPPIPEANPYRSQS